MLTRAHFCCLALLAPIIVGFANVRKHLRRQRRNYKHSLVSSPEKALFQVDAIEKELNQFDLGEEKVIGYINEHDIHRDLVDDRFDKLTKDPYLYSYLVQFCITPKYLVLGRRAEKVLARFDTKRAESIKRLEDQGYEVEKAIPNGLILFRRRRS